MANRSARSLAAEAAFRTRLAELGAELLEPEWLGSRYRYPGICKAGHKCTFTPHEMRSRGSGCFSCSGHDPAIAEANFRARLAELGAELIEPRWLGAQKKHHVRCSEGHDCYPRPASIQQGNGPCWECSGRHTGVAEAEFRKRLATIGAVPLYSEWRGTSSPHAVRCASGHECTPVPSRLQQGQGICSVCAQRDTNVARLAFQEAVASLGGTILDDDWRGIKATYHVRCPVGHDCYPRPNDVQQGKGLCRACAGRDPAIAEAAFRRRLDELGATPLFDAWQGAQRPHLVRCSAGHECSVRPSSVIYSLQGICRKCAGLDPEIAEATFRAALAAEGATPLYDQWRGVDRHHRVRCAEGHEADPRPTNVSRGGPICAECADHAGWAATVFYVLENSADHLVKFGISSRDGKRRLADHRADGFSGLHLLRAGLPPGAALRAEQEVRAALALAGESPQRGREYFDISCLALVLDVAGSWLVVDPAPLVDTESAAVGWVQGALFAA